jgi:hypothetical protein
MGSYTSSRQASIGRNHHCPLGTWTDLECVVDELYMYGIIADSMRLCRGLDGRKLAGASPTAKVPS